jgi:hypothetical protein
VEVLDDEHRAGGELVERGGEHVLARRPSSAASSAPPACARDVAQRAHRARRDERVARAPEHAPRPSRRTPA